MSYKILCSPKVNSNIIQISNYITVSDLINFRLVVVYYAYSTKIGRIFEGTYKYITNACVIQEKMYGTFNFYNLFKI